MSIEQTKAWFEIAVPNPTPEAACIQIGCHIEEVAEMFEALNLFEIADTLHQIGNIFKTQSDYTVDLVKGANLTELADAMGDQQVTAMGVMHMFNMDAVGILGEINRSNFSKFEDGKPVFDGNGKITKGENYTHPNLKPFI